MAKPTKVCPACKGTTNCTNCGGKGRTLQGGLSLEPCKKCNESGNCTGCGGTGVVPIN